MAKLICYSAEVQKMAYKITGMAQLEFVISVIAICVLALVAIPRVSQLQVYARVAKLQTLRASVISASNMVHAGLLIRKGKADSKVCAGGSRVANNLNGATGTLCMDDGIVNLVYGYPAVTEFANIGILSVAGLTAEFNPSAEQVQGRGYDYVKAGNAAIFRVTGGSDASHCSFTYTEATANAAPVVSFTTETGC